MPTCLPLTSCSTSSWVWPSDLSCGASYLSGARKLIPGPWRKACLFEARSASSLLPIHANLDSCAGSRWNAAGGWNGTGEAPTEHELERLISEARSRPQHSPVRLPSRQAIELGEWRCATCSTFKPTDDSHKAQIQQVCKDCDRRSRYIRSCTLRANMLRLLSNARHRAMGRDRECTLTIDELLDKMWAQRGRCLYSGVPMECWSPHSHWRMSLERLNNNHGYTNDNVALIACEFNTTSHAYKDASRTGVGSAQWSKRKVMQVQFLQAVDHDKHTSDAIVHDARCGGRRGGKRFPRHPNDAGEWLCAKCDMLRAKEEFYSSRRSGTFSWCRACTQAYRFEYARTLRGNVVKLLGSARRHAKALQQEFALLSDDVFDMFLAQGGRCYYSGVPMCIIPHSDWRLSLERLDNEAGYLKDNCVLVALEFNTPDYSRNKNALRI